MNLEHNHLALKKIKKKEYNLVNWWKAACTIKNNDCQICYRHCKKKSPFIYANQRHMSRMKIKNKCAWAWLNFTNAFMLLKFLFSLPLTPIISLKRQNLYGDCILFNQPLGEGPCNKQKKKQNRIPLLL